MRGGERREVERDRERGKGRRDIDKGEKGRVGKEKELHNLHNKFMQLRELTIIAIPYRLQCMGLDHPTFMYSIYSSWALFLVSTY